MVQERTLKGGFLWGGRRGRARLLIREGIETQAVMRGSNDWDKCCVVKRKICSQNSGMK